MSLSAKIKVGKTSFDRFAFDLKRLSLEALSRVVDRLEETGTLTANDDEERLVLRLMKEVNVVSRHVPASSASKVAMRNEIRGMMMHLGLPSFYITINPADIYNPIVRYLAGENIDVDALFSVDSAT